MRKNLFASSFFKSIYCLLGVLGWFFIVHGSVLNSADYTSANLSIIPSLIILSYFWFTIFKPKNTNQVILNALFSILLSCIFVIGGQLNTLSTILWSSATIIKTILGAFGIFPFLELLILAIQKIYSNKSFVINRKIKILSFSIPLILCIAAWIIFLPGIYTYDMAVWNEKLSTGTITSHWSVTYGYLLAGFLDISNTLFKNYDVGFAVAMLLQSIFICYVIYRIILFTSQKTNNMALFFTSIFFYILTPFIPFLAITNAQDVLFGGLLTLIILEVNNFVSVDNYYTKKWNVSKLILFSFLLLTLRNNGIICLILLFITTLFYKIPARKTILSSVIIVLLLNFIYSGPFFRLINVEENMTTAREIFGISSQQIARSYYLNPSSFSDEDKQQLEKFYNLNHPSYSFSNYKSFPLISDFTKGAFNQEYLKNHIAEYCMFWIKIGSRNIKNYIEAFALNSLGFWYPIKNYPDERLKIGYMNYTGFSMTTAFKLEKHANMKPVYRAFPDSNITKNVNNFIYKNTWNQTPIISLFCSIGTYTILLLYSLCTAISKKAYIWILILSPVIGLLITLFLAPAALYRYAFPLALLTPFFFFITVSLTRKSNISRRH